MRKITYLFLCLSSLCFGQSDQLSCFENLVNHEWRAVGKWGNGMEFRQNTIFESTLNSQIIKAMSYGFIDEGQTKFGLRSEGIRMYDETAKEVRFWEFDVFGGITEGQVVCKNKSIFYHYDYGESKITDMWEFVNDSTYNFIVGSFDDGRWEQKYLETQFKKDPIDEHDEIYLKLIEKLSGHWSSIAWDGELDETWEVDQNNLITQKAKYSEDKIVLFESSNKIDIIDGELILSSIIKDSNPKIFKATFVSSNRVVFENTEYSYPNKVTYEFIDESRFNRTISGIENGQSREYTFEFKRVK